MNQLTGYDVPKELPIILRNLGVECSRQHVNNEEHFNEVAARYFASMAGLRLRGTSIASKKGLVTPPPPPPKIPPTQPPVSRDPPPPLPQEVIRSPIKPQQPPRALKN
eukprot:PhF_6_TR2649/c0_g1_i1/m.4424